MDGVGIEVSPTGALFALKDKPPTEEFTLQFKVGERLITSRVMTDRHDQFSQGGQTWHRFATKFVGIAADDWDAVVRFVNDLPEPDEKGVDEIKAAMHAPDDAFRMLPLSVQSEIVSILVQMRKLMQPGPGQAPLLKMKYLGQQRKGDTEIHRCQVHSRYTTDGEVFQFDTVFTIDGTGKVAVQGR